MLYGPSERYSYSLRMQKQSAFNRRKQLLKLVVFKFAPERVNGLLMNVCCLVSSMSLKAQCVSFTAHGVYSND